MRSIGRQIRPQRHLILVRSQNILCWKLGRGCHFGSNRPICIFNFMFLYTFLLLLLLMLLLYFFVGGGGWGDLGGLKKNIIYIYIYDLLFTFLFYFFILLLLIFFFYFLFYFMFYFLLSFFFIGSDGPPYRGYCPRY